MQDVIGRDEDERPSRARLPSPRELRRPAGVAVAAAVVCGAALVLARPPAAPQAPHPAAVVERHMATATGPTASGELTVRVVGVPTDAEVASVDLAAPGLQVLSVEPAPSPAGALEEAPAHLLRYRVPDCAELRLPAELEVTLAGGAGHARALGRTRAPGDAQSFRPCPAGAVPPPALAVRVGDSRTETTATGARGAVRLAVHNGGPDVRLLSVTAEVPGVRSASIIPAHAAHLRQDEHLEVVLRFEIEDCTRVLRTGRLVLRAVRHGVERELGLTLGHELEARRLRQVALDGVLDACAR